MRNYNRKQFLELLHDLPKDLSEAMESDRTVQAIITVSQQTKLNEEEHSALVKLVGDVLLGLVPPSQFEKTLVADGVKKAKAKKIEPTIRRLVFYPVRKTLSELYGEVVSVPVLKKDMNVEKISTKKKLKKEVKDKYREKID